VRDLAEVRAHLAVAIAKNEGKGAKLLQDEIVAKDIADLIGVWTGIPANRMLDSEKSKVLTLGSKLRERSWGRTWRSTW